MAPVRPDNPVHSLGSLYRECFRSLVSFARRICCDDAAAEDVVQDVFISLPATFLHDVAPENRLSYLIVAVRNKARRASASVAIEVALDAAANDPAMAVSSDPLHELARIELAKRLAGAVCELAPGQQEAVRLTKLGPLTRGEAAVALGISEKAIEKRLTAAYSALRRRLTDVGGAHSDELSTFEDGGG